MHLVAIGGSDAGISAALRARELDPTTEVTVVVADAYPNFSICGIPYYVSGEVTHWRNLAHRTLDDLKATGMQVRLNTLATKIDVGGHRLHVVDEEGVRGSDRLRPARGRDRRRLGPAAHRGPRRSRGAGTRRRGAPAALHGRHLRAGAHARGGPAGQCGDRGRRLHRARDGGGTSDAGPLRHPVRAAPRGAPDRRPEPGCARQCRADGARRRREDQHDGQAHRPRTQGLGRPLPDRRHRVFRVPS